MSEWPEALKAKLAGFMGKHELVLAGSRNLGYYRTEYDCACGTTLWFGVHEGDPKFDEAWGMHLAASALDALELREESGQSFSTWHGRKVVYKHQRRFVTDWEDV